MEKKNSKAAPRQDLAFEDALGQLESIIDRIEGGKVGLEVSIAEYERGVALLKHCRDVLKRAEQRVEQLNREVVDTSRAPDDEGEAADGQSPESSL